MTKLEFTFPTTWGDITWRQYEEILSMDELTHLDAVSILTQKPIDFWRAYTDFAAYLELAKEAMTLLNTPPKWEDFPLNYRFEYLDKVYEMPKDIGQKSIGQWVDCENEAKKMQPGSEEEETVDMGLMRKVYGNLVRLYLYPVVYGEYDYEKAIDMDIGDLKAADVINWGAFFLLKSTGLFPGIIPGLPPWDGQMMKIQPVTLN